MCSKWPHNAASVQLKNRFALHQQTTHTIDCTKTVCLSGHIKNIQGLVNLDT